MQAEIVMIGSELLLGEIVDTNANKLAKALRHIGLDLYYKTTVGDNEARIIEVLDRALDRSDVIITSRRHRAHGGRRHASGRCSRNRTGSWSTALRWKPKSQPDSAGSAARWRKTTSARPTFRRRASA